MLRFLATIIFFIYYASSLTVLKLLKYKKPYNKYFMLESKDYSLLLPNEKACYYNSES